MKGISGSENHLLTLLAGINKERFELHLGILAETVHIDELQEFCQTLTMYGVHVKVFPMRKHLDFSLILSLRRYIRQHRFHIVHTHLIHADLYGTLAAKLAGVSTIFSSRHNDDRFRHHPLIRWLNYGLARWHTKIIVISDWVGRFLQDVEGIPSSKIVRIHYGLQAEEFSEQYAPVYVRQKFKLSEHAPLIGTIGRLTEQKGQAYLLRAVQQVKAQFPDLRLIIVGDGELRDQLHALAQELDVADNVIFAGWQAHEEALRLLSGFDVFVFPSLWEGFGLVLLEAMALKKAIIASRVSAIPESVIDGRTGLLVQPRQAEQLANAISTLLSDRSLIQRMEAAGYEHLQRNFSVQKMVSATENVYDECLSSLRKT